jgi:hypothetical protein
MNETPTKPAETETKPELIFPKTEDAMFVYDNKTSMFWVGIPVNKTEPLIAMCILDTMKMNYFQAFSQYITAQKNKIEVQSPGVLNQMRKNFVSKFKK